MKSQKVILFVFAIVISLVTQGSLATSDVEPCNRFLDGEEKFDTQKEAIRIKGGYRLYISGLEYQDNAIDCIQNANFLNRFLPGVVVKSRCEQIESRGPVVWSIIDISDEVVARLLNEEHIRGEFWWDKYRTCAEFNANVRNSNQLAKGFYFQTFHFKCDSNQRYSRKGLRYTYEIYTSSADNIVNLR